MATTMTLAQLRTAIRERGDFKNSTGDYTNSFITDSELNSYINQSYFELYDLLIQKYGDDYFVKVPPYSFQTDGQNQFFNLPSDFYKLLGVDLALSNTTDSFVSIWGFNFGDRNRYAVPNFQSFYGVTNLRCRLANNSLWLTPTPQSGQTIQLWYIPRLTTLSADSDTCDGISGWTEYIIVDGVIKCKQKEESDVQVEMLQKQALIQRIESAAENRNASAPPTVLDKQYSDFWWPTGNGGGSGGGFW